MSDLVDKLNAEAAAIAKGGPLWSGETERLILEAAAELTRLRSLNAELVEAIQLVRSIIVDGATTGFNCHDGDWAERLYTSQAVTHRALARANGGGTP
jgi:hypothetical protein